MPKPRVATKRTLTDFHKEIGAILIEADRLKAMPHRNDSAFAIITAKYAVKEALDQWEQIEFQGLKGLEKRQALADMNESLERRRSEMRRFFTRNDLKTPMGTLKSKQ